MHNGALVRYAVVVLLNLVTEWMVFLGVLTYVFETAGSGRTGVASIALLVPYIVVAPMAGCWAEQLPPQRVRLTAMAVQVGAFGAAAGSARAGADWSIVVAAATIGIGATTTLEPAAAVLRPAIVRSSRELTVANLWVGHAGGVGVLAGPLLATAMLGLGGPPAVLVACAVVASVALGLSLVRRPVDPPGSGDARRGQIAVLRAAIVELRDRPGAGGVLAVAGGQYLLLGALDIIVVVAAESELGLGTSGPGVLTTLLGVGSLASSAIAILLVRRRRLAPVLIITMAGMAVCSILLGVVLTVPAAVLLLPALGLMQSLQNLLSQLLLQRSADPEALGPVFALREMAAGIGLLLGSLLSQVTIALVDVRTALVVVGAVFALLLLATVGSLRAADDAADVPVVEMSLLRRVPLFTPLPRQALEAVARSSFEVTVAPGETVIRAGDPGERFYTVCHGQLEVLVDGRVVGRCERGDSFGELALLGDVPRTATVTAVSAGTLLAVGRTPFLIAVTGHDSSRQAVWALVQRLQGELTPLDGRHEFARPDEDEQDDPDGRADQLADGGP